MKRTAIIVFGLVLSLGGCAELTQPKANPVIVNRTPQQGNFTETQATTAERRLVLIRHLGIEEKQMLKQAGLFATDGFCAEPSPDGIEALSASLNASASNAIGDTNQELTIGQALTTSAALATKRTQGLQFYRDTIFGLCQARMNGFMSNDEFRKQLEEAREAAEKMILAEIKTPGFNTAPTVNVNVTQVKPSDES